MMMLEIVSKRAELLKERGVDPDTGKLRTVAKSEELGRAAAAAVHLEEYAGWSEEFKKVAKVYAKGLREERSWAEAAAK